MSVMVTKYINLERTVSKWRYPHYSTKSNKSAYNDGYYEFERTLSAFLHISSVVFATPSNPSQHLRSIEHQSACASRTYVHMHDVPHPDSGHLLPIIECEVRDAVLSRHCASQGIVKSVLVHDFDWRVLGSFISESQALSEGNSVNYSEADSVAEDIDHDVATGDFQECSSPAERASMTRRLAAHDLRGSNKITSRRNDP